VAVADNVFSSVFLPSVCCQQFQPSKIINRTLFVSMQERKSIIIQYIAIKSGELDKTMHFTYLPLSLSPFICSAEKSSKQMHLNIFTFKEKDIPKIIGRRFFIGFVHSEYGYQINSAV